MTIKKIVELQQEWDIKIKEASNKIHPKLLGTLAYEDFFNQDLFNNNLNDKYNDLIRPLVSQAKIESNNACDEYLLNFVNDLALIIPCTGYLTSTGKECHRFKGSFPYDYIPSVEVEPIWEGVNQLRYDYVYRPFWEANNYTVFGNNESVVITRDYYNKSSQLHYMQTNREKFQRSFGETNLQKLERAIKLRETHFDYPIYVPGLSPNDDNAIKGHVEEAVRRHLILKKIMESTDILDTDITFKSIVTIDGDVTLRGTYGGTY